MNDDDRQEAMNALVPRIESALNSIAHRRHGGERVSDQAEAIAVALVALDALEGTTAKFIPYVEVEGIGPVQGGYHPWVPGAAFADAPFKVAPGEMFYVKREPCELCGSEWAESGPPTEPGWTPQCPMSQRPCGHHCNHVPEQDCCHWCGHEFIAEDADTDPRWGVPA